MRLIIDTVTGTLTEEGEGTRREIDLYSPESFRLLSRQWLNVGWDLKYSYGFTWLGVPIIQLPEDLLLIQEIIWRLRPDVIIETGFAHGGSAVFYAGLCKCLGKGRVISIDVEIRPRNRAAVESHVLSPWITLIEGDSVAAATGEKVGRLIEPGETVLVILDSKHTRDHVLQELELYSRFVTPGSYLVAADGYMEYLADLPRGEPGWKNDNPKKAAEEFAARRPDFSIVDPGFLFNEGEIDFRVTYWPAAFLQRSADA